MTKTTIRRVERRTRRSAAELAPAIAKTDADACVLNANEAAPASERRKSAATQTPRAGTKMAALVAVLSTPEGATIAAMRDLTGWQDHSVRGVLTGALKGKFGLAIVSTKEETRGRVYRAAAPNAQAPDAQAPVAAAE